MIISESKDISTNKVSLYLIKTGGEFKRVNIDDTINEEMLYNNDNFSWLRRGNFPSSIKTVSSIDLEIEYQNLNRYFHYIAEQNPNCLGSLVKEYNHNKLVDLHKAQEVGLSIPETHVVNQKATLQKLLSTNKQWITKAIKDPISIEKNGIKYSAGFTSELTEEILEKLPDTFFPSLVQEKIEKQFEIRVFYLKGEFYAMAIFSQRDKQTKIDFRHYNREKPNRNIPFQLPKNLEQKIDVLMSKLELNTGSLDFIVNKVGEFIFLECNPVGQFDWVSGNCNYEIERRIAEILSDAA